MFPQSQNQSQNPFKSIIPSSTSSFSNVNPFQTARTFNQQPSQPSNNGINFNNSNKSTNPNFPFSTSNAFGNNSNDNNNGNNNNNNQNSRNVFSKFGTRGNKTATRGGHNVNNRNKSKNNNGNPFQSQTGFQNQNKFNSNGPLKNKKKDLQQFQWKKNNNSQNQESTPFSSSSNSAFSSNQAITSIPNLPTPSGFRNRTHQYIPIPAYLEEEAPSYTSITKQPDPWDLQNQEELLKVENMQFSGADFEFLYKKVYTQQTGLFFPSVFKLIMFSLSLN